MRNTLLLLVIALTACKGKPVSHGAGSGSSAAVGSASMGALVPQKSKDVAPDIVLPHSDGSAPIKTTAPLTADKLKTLSDMQFAGFLRSPRAVGDTSLEIEHKTDSRPRVMALVSISTCGSACTPMDLDAWKPKTDELKKATLGALADVPDTVFELGATEVNGAKAIYTTELGQNFTKDEDGNTTGTFLYGYNLYFNDGVNQIKVAAEFKDDPMATKEAMAKLIPRGDLEKVAKSFVDIYTHRWQ